jgi:hypothetical protein
MHVTNVIPLGCLPLLPVGTVNCVVTLKVRQGKSDSGATALWARCSALTMDSAVLRLATWGCDCCGVLGFEQKVTLEDAVGSHVCSLEARASVRPTAYLSGVHFLTSWHSYRLAFLPVGTVKNTEGGGRTSARCCGRAVARARCQRQPYSAFGRHGARLRTESYARECHWIPRMFA